MQDSVRAGSKVVEAVGIEPYVSDTQPYADTRFSGVSLAKARSPTFYSRSLQYPGIS